MLAGRLAFVVFMLVPSFAQASIIQVTHPHGEIVDTGSAAVAISDPRIDCTPPSSVVVRNDRTATVRVNRVPPQVPDRFCNEPPKIDIGTLTAGWWTIVVETYEADGVSRVDSTTLEVRVSTPGKSCNRDHWRGSQLIVLHRSIRGAEIAQRVASDPGFAAYLGGAVDARSLPIDDDHDYAVIDYPPLQDVWDTRAQLQRTGDFLHVGNNGLFCFSPPPGDQMGTLVEYRHAGLDHYFYTSNPEEMRGLDEGTGARGWQRTGKEFDVLLMPGCPPVRVEQAAYRFFGTPGVGPSSHFFTLDREECRVVEKTGAWLYEGATFWAAPTNARGGCDQGRPRRSSARRTGRERAA